MPGRGGDRRFIRSRGIPAGHEDGAGFDWFAPLRTLARGTLNPLPARGHRRRLRLGARYRPLLEYIRAIREERSAVVAERNYPRGNARRVAAATARLDLVISAPTSSLL